MRIDVDVLPVPSGYDNNEYEDGDKAVVVSEMNGIRSALMEPSGTLSSRSSPLSLYSSV